MWSDLMRRQDKNGTHWNFRIWYESWGEGKVVTFERVFFWDDKKAACGVVIFLPGEVPHFSRIKSLISKLVADPDLRKKYRRDLQFPLERYYSGYPAFS